MLDLRIVCKLEFVRPAPVEKNRALYLSRKVGLYQVLANYTIPILYWWKNLLYYTIPIPILYQFLGGFVHGFMFSAWDKLCQKVFITEIRLSYIEVKTH